MKVIMINGPMGIGKTTAGKAIAGKYPGTAFIDGDWCMDIHPFVGNRETKTMAVDNILHMIGNYQKCSQCKMVVLSWLMDDPWVLRSMTDGLAALQAEVKNVTLVCDRETLINRWKNDRDCEWRTDQWLEASLASLPAFASMKDVTDTSGMSVDQIADIIMGELSGGPDMTKKGITIRKAEKEDVRQIAEILVEDWQKAYRGIMDDDFLDAMNADQRYEIEVKRYEKYIVAADGDEILGYAWLEATDEEPADCEVIALYVRYAQRNNGIGKRLMQYAFSHFREAGKKKMIIWCLKENHESRKFYEKAGGKEFRTGTHNWGGKEYDMISYLYDLGQEDQA